MTMRNVFARDENGNIKTKKPCQTPGCDWPNWHICLVGKPDTFPKLLGQLKNKRRSFSGAHRASISAGQSERWARLNRERDAKMIEYYKQGNVGYKDVAAKFKINGATALRVLKRAEARGELVMRKRGHNIRHLINN